MVVHDSAVIQMVSDDSLWLLMILPFKLISVRLNLRVGIGAGDAVAAASRWRLGASVSAFIFRPAWAPQWITLMGSPS